MATGLSLVGRGQWRSRGYVKYKVRGEGKRCVKPESTWKLQAQYHYGLDPFTRISHRIPWRRLVTLKIFGAQLLQRRGEEVVSHLTLLRLKLVKHTTQAQLSFSLTLLLFFLASQRFVGPKISFCMGVFQAEGAAKPLKNHCASSRNGVEFPSFAVRQRRAFKQYARKDWSLASWFNRLISDLVWRAQNSHQKRRKLWRNATPYNRLTAEIFDEA